MTRRAQLAIDLVEFLSIHDEGVTRAEAEAHLTALGCGYNAFHNLVSYIRNKAGEEVLVATYDRQRHVYVYALALTHKDGQGYLVVRRNKVRNETVNLVQLCDRMIDKFGDDPELRMVRAMLASVVTIMDAARSE